MSWPSFLGLTCCFYFTVTTTECNTAVLNRLVGLVVKASASRAEDPGFESRRDFFGVESYQ